MFLCLSPGPCPLASHCLRHTAWNKLKATPAVRDRLTLEIVNPSNPAIDYATDGCRAYVSDTPVTYARGMEGFFDSVPHERYKSFRAAIQSCFSCRTNFFQSQKGQRRITPEEQKRIATVFTAYALPQPPYQSLETDYNWEAPILI